MKNLELGLQTRVKFATMQAETEKLTNEIAYSMSIWTHARQKNNCTSWCRYQLPSIGPYATRRLEDTGWQKDKNARHFFSSFCRPDA